MDNKGIIFTTDALLALIIVTMALGITINQIDAFNYQLQDFTGRQSLDKTVNDAADYLVKNPGDPVNWERSGQLPVLPGLAVVDSATNPDTTNVYSINNYLDNKKMNALKHLQENNQYPLNKLVYTNNYHLKIVSINNATQYLNIGNDPMTPPAPKEIAVANRTVSLIPGDVLTGLTNLTHINPSNPSENPYLWFYNGQGKPAIYVGPGKQPYSINGSASIPDITQSDLNANDYYIRIDNNQGGVSSVEYGFTNNNWVINGSYGNSQVDPLVNLWTLSDTDPTDRKLEEAIKRELAFINTNNEHGQGWTQITNKQLDQGSTILVNDAIQKVFDKRGVYPLKIWFRVTSKSGATFDVSLIRVTHGADLNKVPAQMVLEIWR